MANLMGTKLSILSSFDSNITILRKDQTFERLSILSSFDSNEGIAIRE